MPDQPPTPEALALMLADPDGYVARTVRAEGLSLQEACQRFGLFPGKLKRILREREAEV